MFHNHEQNRMQWCYFEMWYNFEIAWVDFVQHVIFTFVDVDCYVNHTIVVEYNFVVVDHNFVVAIVKSYDAHLL